ncbi:olfactory receptor 5A2-like [Pseudophryne corroboree]|uniref:olfactory receptor 5A2-like n=1 Tax=Pseudophryne corroboree TaxID=495146 RepID=UPI0030820B0B
MQSGEDTIKVSSAVCKGRVGQTTVLVHRGDIGPDVMKSELAGGERSRSNSDVSNSDPMTNVNQKNKSSVSVFLVVGLSESEEPQPLLFLLFLCIYLTTVIGNIVILTLISSDRRLHTPMYFFLAILSINDIILSSITIPKLLFILFTAQKTILYSECVTQLLLFQLFVVSECYLLAAMAYDRYVAVCFPLNYTLIMSRAVRFRMVVACLACGLGNLIVQAFSISHLDFCGPNRVDHFFCDVTPLFKLSCSGKQFGEVMFFIVVIITGVAPLTFIMVSYGWIIAEITKIASSQGRFRTFSTCSSHFTVVTLYFTSGTLCYIWPLSTYAMDKDVKAVAVLYAIMTPMLNPIIYSLRNKEVKQSFAAASTSFPISLIVMGLHADNVLNHFSLELKFLVPPVSLYQQSFL